MNYTTLIACAVTLAASLTFAAGEPAPSRAGFLRLYEPKSRQAPYAPNNASYRAAR